MKYRVTVQRECWEESDFDVEAGNETEAEQKAMALASDHEFGSGNARYEVMMCEELDDGAENFDKRVKVVCAMCGSEDVLLDAWAKWNPELQKAELVTTFGIGHFCNACVGTCRIKEIPLEG